MSLSPSLAWGMGVFTCPLVRIVRPESRLELRDLLDGRLMHESRGFLVGGVGVGERLLVIVESLDALLLGRRVEHAVQTIELCRPILHPQVDVDHRLVDDQFVNPLLYGAINPLLRLLGDHLLGLLEDGAARVAVLEEGGGGARVGVEARTRARDLRG